MNTNIRQVFFFACLFHCLYTHSHTIHHYYYYYYILLCLKHSKSTIITIVIIAVISNHSRVAPLGPHCNSISEQHKIPTIWLLKSRTGFQIKSSVIINTVAVQWDAASCPNKRPNTLILKKVKTPEKRQGGVGWCLRLNLRCVIHI